MSGIGTVTHLFYNNSILSGTKIICEHGTAYAVFYNNSILSGTKILFNEVTKGNMFYNNSILSGTKIILIFLFLINWFYNNSILSGTKMSNHIFTPNFIKLSSVFLVIFNIFCTYLLQLTHCYYIIF